VSILIDRSLGVHCTVWTAAQIYKYLDRTIQQ